MAKLLGKNADFAIGTATIANGPFNYGDAGMTRIEAISNNVALNTETVVADGTVYGDDFDETEIISYKWSVDIEAFVQIGTSPDTEALLMQAFLALLKYPFCLSLAGKPGGEASASQPKYSGRVVIASCSASPPLRGIQTFKIRLNGDGALSRSTS